METSQDIDRLYSLRAELTRKLMKVKDETSLAKMRSPDGHAPTELLSERAVLEQQIEDIQQKIATLKTADMAGDSLKSVTARLEDELRAIRTSVSDPQRVISLEEQIKALTDISNQTIKQLRTVSLTSAIEPKFSILRPNVKLVDANLAYKYADLQSDANTLVGLTTLFLGTGIAAGISLAISLLTSAEQTVIAIHAVVAFMSIIVSGVFGYLARKTYEKSSQVRKHLESEAGEKEFSLYVSATPGED